MLLTPKRLARSAIIIQPSTLLSFHKSLVKRKYLRLFSSTSQGKPESKDLNNELIRAIVVFKECNPGFDYPYIAITITNTYDIQVNKNITQRVLIKHYHPKPRDDGEPS